MIIINSLCYSGKEEKSNEDYIRFRDGRYALLLDGSTGLAKNVLPKELGFQTTAQWFVNRIGEVADAVVCGERIPAGAMNSEQSKGIRDVFYSCMEVCKREYAKWVPEQETLSARERRIAEPSASLGFVWEKEESVELLLLGDLTVILEFSDGKVEVVKDASVEKLDARAIEVLVRESQTNQISVLEAMKCDSVAEVLKENRLKKNSGEPDGYWILGLDEEALEHATIFKWDKKHAPEQILMCSDGFAAFDEKYGLSGGCAEKFLHTAEEQGLEWMYRKLRDVEEEDAKCNKYPRFKKSDDAAAILIKAGMGE